MSTAAQLFTDGYRIVSRAHRVASRCPPDVEPGRALPMQRRAADGAQHLAAYAALDRRLAEMRGAAPLLVDAVARERIHREAGGS